MFNHHFLPHGNESISVTRLFSHFISANSLMGFFSLGLASNGQFSSQDRCKASWRIIIPKMFAQVMMWKKVHAFE